MTDDDGKPGITPSLTSTFVLLGFLCIIGNFASQLAFSHDWTTTVDRIFLQFVALICARFALWLRGTP